MLKTPNRNDSLNRRSWESSKLSSQLEEEEALDAEDTSKDDNVSVNSNKSPGTVKKEERESMFFKLKNFRKGKWIKKHLKIFAFYSLPEMSYFLLYFVYIFTDRHDLFDLKNEKRSNSAERIIIGGENDSQSATTNSRISNELLQKFEGKSREVMKSNYCF